MSLESRVGFAQNAFLGEKARNPDLVKRIDEAALKVDKVLNPIDDAAKRKAVGDSIKLIRDEGIQVDSVTTLNETLVDRNKSDQQRENAEEVLDVLANATYVAMKYGKNEEATKALESGSPEAIKAILPEPLKDLSERVRNVEIANEDIRGILNSLDKKGRVLKAAGEGGKKKLRDNLEDAIGKLSELEVTDERSDEEMMRVSAYLGFEAEEASLEGVVSADSNNPLQELVDLMSGEKAAKVSFNNFVDSVVAGDHFTISGEQPPLWTDHPELVLKDASQYEGEKGLAKWKRLVGISNAAANWLYFKNKGDWRDYSSLMSTPDLKSISQSSVSELFNESPGFRLAARTIFDKLFDRDKSFPDPAVYAIRLKFDSEEPKIGDWSNNFPKFLEEVVLPVLMDPKGLALEEPLARLYAGCAARVFVDISTIDKADLQRKHNGISMDPIRSKYNPEEKALQKAGIAIDKKTGLPKSGDTEGDQQFGGDLGTLIRRLADLKGMPFITEIRDKAEGKYKNEKGKTEYQYTYFPKHTALSWAEMTSVKPKGDANDNERNSISVAQLLMQKNDSDIGEIKFSRGGNDWLWGSYGRDIAPAVDFFGDLFKGKIKMDFKKLDEFTKELSNQRTEVLKCGIPGGDHSLMKEILDNPKFIAMSIVAAMPGELGINESVLLPGLSDTQYNQTVDMILKGISGITENMREQVRKELHAGPASVVGSIFREATADYKDRQNIRNQTRRNVDQAKYRHII